MAFGARSHRLTLQQPTGSSGTGFTDVETVWGSLTMPSPTAGPERLQGGAPTAIATWSAEIAHRSDVRAEWRVVDVESSRVFQISSYGDPDGYRRDLRLVLTEIQ